MSYQVRLWTFVIKYELCLASDVSKYLIKQSYPCINVTALVESKWWSKEPNRTLNICSILTLGRTRKFITPSCLQGRGEGVGDGTLPRVFDMLQYLETSLPLVESIWSCQQYKGYIMSGGAAGAQWRHQQWSPSWPPSWILPRIKNQVKTARNRNFLCLT